MPKKFVLEGKVEEADVDTELQYQSLVENEAKVKSTLKFHRHGDNKRQDHATKGTAMPKGYNRAVGWKDHRFNRKYLHVDAINFVKRRDFRAAGRQITGTF